MNVRLAAAAIAAGRVGLGAALAAAPASFGRAWIGTDASLPGGRTAVRATGIRDVALGLGLLVAMRRGRPVRGWLEAAAVADVGDLVFTLMGFRHLPPLGRLVTLASAGSAAVIAMRIAGDVDAHQDAPLPRHRV
jgi:hypothetical protein